MKPKTCLTAFIIVCCLGAVVAFMTAAAAQSGQPLVREELHRTLPLDANGSISLDNINGDVSVKVWDRNEVQLDAVKTATTAQRLAEVAIDIESSPAALEIRTKYPSGEMNRGEVAAVAYSLTVPRAARLRRIELINGALDIDAVGGDVRASTINGRLNARGLGGEARLSTVNGRLVAVFDKLPENKNVTLSAVNGALEITLPSAARAHLKANTLHGGISNDFNLSVRRGTHIGHDLMGTLGGGATTRVQLNTVNGAIAIRRAADGGAPGAVVDLLAGQGDASGAGRQEGASGQPFGPEFDRQMREAMREAARAEREVARAMGEQKQVMARELKRVQREVDAAMGGQKEAVARELKRVQRQIDETFDEQSVAQFQAAADAAREAGEAVRAATSSMTDSMATRTTSVTKNFTVAGVPRVTIESVGGPVTVRAWDKSEVRYTVFQRVVGRDGSATTAGQPAPLREEQNGRDVVISTRNAEQGAGTSVVRIEVNVPRRADLKLSSDDGRLTVEGVEGDMELTTADGAIDVRGARGSVRAVTGDGRISVLDFDGAAEARSGDGRISLRGRFNQLDAQTGDGVIALSLPPDFDASIETQAETVTSDKAFAAEDADESKRVRRWKIGRGGNRLLKLRAEEDRVILRSESTQTSPQ